MKGRLCVVVLLATLAVAVPVRAEPTASAEGIQFRHVNLFSRVSRSTVIYLDIFSIDFQGAWHDGALQPGAGQARIVYGCLMIAKSRFVDIACGMQNSNALTMDADQSKAHVDFRGRSMRYRKTFTAVVDVVGSGDAIRTPFAEYELPTANRRAITAMGALHSYRYGTSTVRATATGLSAIRASKVRTPMQLLAATTAEIDD